MVNDRAAEGAVALGVVCVATVLGTICWREPCSLIATRSNEMSAVCIPRTTAAASTNIFSQLAESVTVNLVASKLATATVWTDDGPNLIIATLDPRASTDITHYGTTRCVSCITIWTSRKGGLATCTGPVGVIVWVVVHWSLADQAAVFTNHTRPTIAPRFQLPGLRDRHRATTDDVVTTSGVIIGRPATPLSGDE